MTITTLNSVASSAVARWIDPDTRPLFKGKLIGDDGCACAQGDVLLNNGFTAIDLRKMEQNKADKETAQLLGISRAHAILLRNVNDKSDGSPENVLTAPELILGDQAHIVLAFWRHMDRMTADQWDAAWDAARDAAWAAARDSEWDAAREAARDAAMAAAWDAARAAAWDAAWDAARDAAMAAARDAARAAARDAARDAARAAARDAAKAAAAAAARAAARSAATYACAEIQGARIMREKGIPFYFLPMFGFADPEAVLAADEAASEMPTN